MKNSSQFKNGFTMIELIMVMGILAILATFFMTSFPASQRRARDTQRRNDINQYRAALEVYANNHNTLYPESGQVQADLDAFCVTILAFTSGQCPKDPKDNAYYYQSDQATEYVLWVKLEQPTSHDYWIVCSDGRSGEKASAPSSSTCPL